MAIISTLLILSLLMFVHELGHFVLAKINHVRVEEFSLGMGTKLWQTQKGDTYYTLRLFPIGAYVKMLGEEEEDASEGSLFSKSIGQRIAIFFAGPFMNFVLALLLFIGVYMFIGVPSNSNVVGEILDNTPALTMGLQEGDRIIDINGQKITSWLDISNNIQKVGAQEISLTVSRSGQQLQLHGYAKYQPSENRYVLGFVQSWDKYSILGSMKYGLVETYNFTKTILVSLVEMATGKIPVDISGPVGMVSAVESVSSYGFANILVFTAILSINLGIINLLPFPALDGSRIVFSLIQLVRGKPLDHAKENAVHFIGLMILFGLMILITYNDIMKLFS